MGWKDNNIDKLKVPQLIDSIHYYNRMLLKAKQRLRDVRLKEQLDMKANEEKRKKLKEETK